MFWNRQVERAEEMRALGWSVTVVADVPVFEKAGDNYALRGQH